jgi:hypothetical protein
VNQTDLDILEMYFKDGMSEGEIARSTGVSIFAVHEVLAAFEDEGRGSVLPASRAGKPFVVQSLNWRGDWTTEHFDPESCHCTTRAEAEDFLAEVMQWGWPREDLRVVEVQP